MMNLIGRPDQIETRLTAWILYLLRGGKPEVLERLLASGAYPPESRYRILSSVLSNNATDLEEIIRDDDRDLLLGKHLGYLLDLNPNDLQDRLRMKALWSVARVIKNALLLSSSTTFRRQGIFRDQADRLVDIDLTITRDEASLLLGDFLAPIAGFLLGQSPPSSNLASDYDEQHAQGSHNDLLDFGHSQPPPTDPRKLFDELALLANRDPESYRTLHRDILQQARVDEFQSDVNEPERDGALDQMRFFTESDKPAIDQQLWLQLALEHHKIPKELRSFVIIGPLKISDTTLTVLAEKNNKRSKLRLRAVLKIILPQAQIHTPSEPMRAILTTFTRETILPFHDAFETGSLVILVMEHMPRGNLINLLEEAPSSDRFKLIQQAFGDVCDALVFAHQRGVAHRKITPKKILFSQELQRFRLVFRYPFAPDATPEEAFAEAAQKDLNDFATVFQGLISNVEAPWLGQLLQRCQTLSFQDAGELRHELDDHLAPEKGLIVLTAERPDEETIHYDLAVGGAPHPLKLSFFVPKSLIENLGGQWNRLGELALRRARTPHKTNIDAIDQKIRQQLGELSENVTNCFLEPTVRSELQKARRASLWLRFAESLSVIPWELLELGGSRICRQFHVARSPKLLKHDDYPTPPKGRKLELLILEDLDGNLPGAREECRRLREAIDRSPLRDNLVVTTVGKETERLRLHTLMKKSDVIHFAGHGIFDEEHAYDNGLSLGRGETLKAWHLDKFWSGKVPFLFFANACVSSRANQDVLEKRVFVDAATGLGPTFLSAGVGNYVGTLWDTPDGGATIEFAIEFYRWFLSGSTVSRAIRAARELCIKKYGEEDLTWARYVLFGHPLNRIDI